MAFTKTLSETLLVTADVAEEEGELKMAAMLRGLGEPGEIVRDLDDIQNKLADECRNLLSLYDDPHPGLFTWCNFEREIVKAIFDTLRRGGCKTKEEREEHVWNHHLGGEQIS